MARYLLWDHDGVLVDTERWYFEATRRALARIDIELSQERYLEFMAVGRPCWDLARARGLCDQEIQLRRAERDALYQDFLRSMPIEIDGVAEVLAELAARHRMAIVTTSRRSDFDLIHAGRELLRHFEFALTVEDYPRSKPHPDPYLAGLARFGAQPEEALVLEDSARGLGSARAAGLLCLVIRSPFTVSQDFTGAWRVVDSIRDVPRVLAG
jgi:HAD superfamily hydrolase (TIGR01509 family)